MCVCLMLHIKWPQYLDCIHLNSLHIVPYSLGFFFFVWKLFLKLTS